MDKYDYEEAVKEDVESYLKENVEGHIDDDKYQELYDEMFVSDSVTGNASGSYTMNAWEAEENLCHNLDLLRQAETEFGGDVSKWLTDPEGGDVTIRCYILGQVMQEVVDKWNETHPEEDETDETEE